MLISGGIQSSLFTYDRSVVRQQDEDLDAALRSRGHPGLRFGTSKAQSTTRVPAVKVSTGLPHGPLRIRHLLIL